MAVADPPVPRWFSNGILTGRLRCKVGSAPETQFLPRVCATRDKMFGNFMISQRKVHPDSRGPSVPVLGSELSTHDSLLCGSATWKAAFAVTTSSVAAEPRHGLDPRARSSTNRGSARSPRARARGGRAATGPEDRRPHDPASRRHGPLRSSAQPVPPGWRREGRGLSLDRRRLRDFADVQDDAARKGGAARLP